MIKLLRILLLKHFLKKIKLFHQIVNFHQILEDSLYKDFTIHFLFFYL